LVPREALETVLDVARWAPNGGNLQPWRFVVVLEHGLRRGLADAACGQSFLAAAPVVIAVCAVPGESAKTYGARGRDLYCLQDTAAAIQNMLLAATELGLGTCWVGSFDERRVAMLLNLQEGWRPVALVAMGYPAEQAGLRSRRSLTEIVEWRE
jgi:nitroreductase